MSDLTPEALAELRRLADYIRECERWPWLSCATTPAPRVERLTAMVDEVLGGGVQQEVADILRALDGETDRG